jgi:hypothetical protein
MEDYFTQIDELQTLQNDIIFTKKQFNDQLSVIQNAIDLYQTDRRKHGFISQEKEEELEKQEKETHEKLIETRRDMYQKISDCDVKVRDIQEQLEILQVVVNDLIDGKESFQLYKPDQKPISVYPEPTDEIENENEDENENKKTKFDYPIPDDDDEKEKDPLGRFNCDKKEDMC